jgi:hypothetical protein
VTGHVDPDRVYTVADIRAAGGLLDVRNEGTIVRLTPDRRTVADRVSDYVVVSPCCGKRTSIYADVIEQVATGHWANTSFECGKAWANTKGNPRRGGCRAQYAVTVPNPSFPVTELVLTRTGR